MRTHNVSMAVLAVAMAVLQSACGADQPTTVAVAQRAARSMGSSAERPLTGTCETSFAPLTLPPPPIIRQVDQGVCTLSHLGRTTMYAVQDIDPVAGTQRSVEITFTAANGDVLRATSAGTNTPNGPGVAFQATMTFVGGTGRFANAIGEAYVDGTADFVTSSSSFRLDGRITYDALPNKN
jgi:hypothetical protein